MRPLDGYRAQLGESLSILKVSWGRCFCSDSVDLFPHCCVGHPSSTVSNTSTPLPTRIRFNKTSNPSSTAFFLTAHFSQEDYPYDWCATVTPSCVTSLRLHAFQAHALALEGALAQLDHLWRAPDASIIATCLGSQSRVRHHHALRRPQQPHAGHDRRPRGRRRRR